MPEERLQKALARLGVSSRRAAEKLILDGRVKVNGKVVGVLGTKVDPEKDKIEVDGQKKAAVPPLLYVLLYKPSGYITSVKDEKGRRTVFELLRGIEERVYPVGRLDYGSSGVLLLTNDGELTNRLLHPAYEVQKTYRMEVEGEVAKSELALLRAGVRLEDGLTAPAKVQTLKFKDGRTTLEITIHEGRNRQVRRMLEAVGHSVRWLQRTGFASLTLAGLTPGQWRYLTAEEIAALKSLKGQK